MRTKIVLLLMLIGCLLLNTVGYAEKAAADTRLTKPNAVPEKTITAGPPGPSPYNPPATPLAKAIVLIEANSQRILYEKNRDIPVYPASTTKIVTLYTALKRGNLDSIVTIDSTVADVEGASLELKPGDRLTLRELLSGMMIVSGNDAAEAVAKNIADSRETFIRWMNDYAAELGAQHTKFYNPHGLPDDRHVTTALDMAMIASGAIKLPEFMQIVSTREKYVQFLNREPLKVTNTNKLLFSYPGCIGLKTGFTWAAGDCLVAAATRNGKTLIAVIYDDDDRWEDAANLFDWGFFMMEAKNTNLNQNTANTNAGNPKTPPPNIRN